MVKACGEPVEKNCIKQMSCWEGVDSSTSRCVILHATQKMNNVKHNICVGLVYLNPPALTTVHCVRMFRVRNKTLIENEYKGNGRWDRG